MSLILVAAAHANIVCASSPQSQSILNGKNGVWLLWFFVTRIIRHTYESLKYENIELVDTNVTAFLEIY